MSTAQSHAKTYGGLAPQTLAETAFFDVPEDLLPPGLCLRRPPAGSSAAPCPAPSGPWSRVDSPPSLFSPGLSPPRFTAESGQRGSSQWMTTATMVCDFASHDCVELSRFLNCLSKNQQGCGTAITALPVLSTLTGHNLSRRPTAA